MHVLREEHMLLKMIAQTKPFIQNQNKRISSKLATSVDAFVYKPLWSFPKGLLKPPERPETAPKYTLKRKSNYLS